MADSLPIIISMTYDLPCEAFHFAWRNEGPHKSCELRQSALNPLESLAGVTLCAEGTRLSPLPAWLTKVAQWVSLALFKFGVARGGLEALRPHGVMAHL